MATAPPPRSKAPKHKPSAPPPRATPNGEAPPAPPPDTRTEPSGPHSVRAVPPEEVGLKPRPPRGNQQDVAVPGRKRPPAAASIRTLHKTEAAVMVYVAERTDDAPLTGCPIADLERHVAETIGTPVHHAIEQLYEIKDLLTTPIKDGGIPMTRNLIATERGLALADLYSQGRLVPLPDPEAPPQVNLPGDERPERPVAPNPRTDPRPAPSGDFGNARGVRQIGESLRTA